MHRSKVSSVKISVDIPSVEIKSVKIAIKQQNKQ